MEKTKTKPKVKTKARTRSDAILIQPTKSVTFADILKNFRTNVKSEDSGAIVRSIRQARKGGVLVELDKETTDEASFSEAVERAAGNMGTVWTLVTTVNVEVCDLDAYTEQAKVIEALNRELPDAKSNFEVRLTKENIR